MGKSLVGSPMHPGPDKNLARTWALRRGPCFESATLKSEGTRGGLGVSKASPVYGKTASAPTDRAIAYKPLACGGVSDLAIKL